MQYTEEAYLPDSKCSQRIRYSPACRLVAHAGLPHCDDAGKAMKVGPQTHLGVIKRVKVEIVLVLNGNGLDVEGPDCCLSSCNGAVQASSGMAVPVGRWQVCCVRISLQIHMHRLADSSSESGAHCPFMLANPPEYGQEDMEAHTMRQTNTTPIWTSEQPL